MFLKQLFAAESAAYYYRLLNLRQLSVRSKRHGSTASEVQLDSRNHHHRLHLLVSFEWRERCRKLLRHIRGGADFEDVAGWHPSMFHRVHWRSRSRISSHINYQERHLRPDQVSTHTSNFHVGDGLC